MAFLRSARFAQPFDVWPCLFLSRTLWELTAESKAGKQGTRTSSSSFLLGAASLELPRTKKAAANGAVGGAPRGLLAFISSRTPLPSSPNLIDLWWPSQSSKPPQRGTLRELDQTQTRIHWVDY